MDPSAVDTIDTPDIIKDDYDNNKASSSYLDAAKTSSSNEKKDKEDDPPKSRPGLFQPGDTSYEWERWCSQKCFRGPPGNRRFIRREESFRFMAVFKWEPRKGWSDLMEAYYRAFYAPLYTNRTAVKEPMLIIVGSSYTPRADTYEPIFLTKLVEKWFKSTSLAEAAAPSFSANDTKKDYSLGMSDFPCTCFLTSALSDSNLVSMYKSVDAFVMTTHGEGWGLPICEAMAMGLPTISTNWGGSTEFTSHGSIPVPIRAPRFKSTASYHINASVMEYAHLAEGYGGERNMKMAAPSIPHTVELLRKVYEQTPEVNREVGRKARDVIVRQFSQAATTDLMTLRLAAVAQNIKLGDRRGDGKGPQTTNS